MKTKLTLILFSAFMLSNHYAFTQTFECGFEERFIEEMSRESGQIDFNCDHANYDLKCVRIKFHYLNNTHEPSLAPSDAFYADLLRKINDAFEPGKIRFTFDDNCVHRVNLTSEVISQINRQSDISNLIGQGEPQMEFDENAINVYSLQQIFPTDIEGTDVNIFLASPFSHAIVPLDHFGWIMHELGHTLGLRHTFSGDQGFYPSAPPLNMALNGLCKDPQAQLSDQVFCKSRGDKICDTGLDPWTLDLGPQGVADGKRDMDKWVDYETCTQLPALLSTIADGCYDTIHAWEIPVKNFMSYYRPCRKEFTPCQLELCHMNLVNRPQLLNCNQDPYLCTAPDITVSGIVKWEGATIQLCPGQKIIIAKDAFLTIDHSTITRRPRGDPKLSCPGLSDLWDGIYIEGEKHTIFGNEYYTNFGRLLIKNNSIIEYSKNGIQAPNGFRTVDIIESTFRNNLAQLNLSFPKPFYDISSGTVNLTNSDFLVGSSELSMAPLAKTQMRVVGGVVTMNNCLLENPADHSFATGITGIQSAKGKLTIINGSRIVNFHIGVDKAGDSRYLYAGGLHLENSSILNSTYAILNTSKFLFAKNNWLEGDIVSEGKCYTQWLSNNIKANYIRIHSPVQSTRFEENLFENLEVEFYGRNELSYLLCNTWKNVRSGVTLTGFDQATLPESWGQINTSSGNRHLDQSSPALFARDHLTNYFFDESPDQHFTYVQGLSLLKGGESVSDRGCSYNYPATPPAYDPDFTFQKVNFTNENNNWIALNTLKAQKESALSNDTSGDIPELLQIINYLSFQMADIVGKVSMNLTAENTSIRDIWIPREDPEIIQFTGLSDMWYEENFIELEEQLGSMDPDEEIKSLLAAVKYMKEICSPEKHVDELDSIELDSLIQLASVTYGDFTNLIRDFLRVEYNIDIPWPTGSRMITHGATNNPSSKKKAGKENRFIITQHLSNQCFTIKSKNKPDEEIFVRLVDLQGKLLKTAAIYAGGTICMDDLSHGMYILTIHDQSLHHLESHKLVL